MLTIDVPMVKPAPNTARYIWKVVHAPKGDLTTILNELESKTEWEIFSVSGEQIILRQEGKLPPPTKDVSTRVALLNRQLQSIVQKCYGDEVRDSLLRVGIIDQQGGLAKRYRK